MSSEPPSPRRFSDYLFDGEVDVVEVREVIEPDGSVKRLYTWTTEPRTPRDPFAHDWQEWLFRKRKRDSFN